nr:MAG TPA: hypothetical protein [Caudoviricetes sp.]
MKNFFGGSTYEFRKTIKRLTQSKRIKANRYPIAYF